ncbi:hypothetical protein GCM10009549_45840 [Streptomyces thermoalcalitolerans]|uniref:Helicase C-terminal domain-containing protein n=1 Tax=Streptomyces thermoalcalitolerans TaxID=65605 RepID=A0ABN1PB40_9ACTN
MLARWSGWGALPGIFNPRPARAGFDSDEAHQRAVERWDALSDVRAQVRSLLSQSEWAAARRNTLNAHYTDAALVQAVWGAVQRLGFQGGRVLEPGSGSGNFIGFAPTLPRGVRMTGVEVEPTTAAISRYLYPDAEIITSGLEEVPLADGGFDAVVGNVPFGRYKRFDKVHNPDLKLSIHDHFVLKSLHATRPGGIVALITSRYTLDAEDPVARERMYRLGDLVGAVRLPARAHAQAAGTDVVTDVLFLRRRAKGEEPGDATWLTSRKRVLPGHDDELAVNAYFDVNPEYVLGDLRARIGQFGPEVTVTGRGARSPAAELEVAVAAIAAEAEAAGLTAAAAARDGDTDRPAVLGGTEGSLGLDAEGNPTIVEGGRAVPLEIHPDQRGKLVQLIRLKAMTQALYEAEAATAERGETPQLARLRAELRTAYRDYRKTNPPLSKPRQAYTFTPPEAKERAQREGLPAVPQEWKERTAYAWIDDDPDASLLFGLEEWDDKTGTATEQQVLHSRVLEPRRLPTRAATAEDAIALAMEWDGGRLDMARVAGLLGTDEESAAAQCANAGLAFRDPDQSDAWEPRHRYLSGNVRAKLAAARERAASAPSFAGNVSALERVQPEDLAPSEIKAKIGAPWIPVDVYNDFLRHLGFDDARVVHAGGTVWEVRGAKAGDLARAEWGTPQRPTQALFEALLRQTDSIIRVTHTDSEGRTYVDQDATDAAQEKAKLIADAFEDWVWADENRAARLATLYNEQFNNLVLPEYSTLPLTLPGLVADWEMRPHQNAAIRRIVNEPTALLAHVVGAGKTATMAAGAMELRRTGLAKKPCIVVPNHMLKQWTREFRELYPNAKLLAISASDLGKKRRAKFMARIAGGDWDAVILTHEAFNRVPLRPQTQRTYLARETASLREQLERAAESGMDSRTVKQIENTIANAEATIEQQIESMSDDVGVFLEDTGIDYLFLDEAHEYKNLRTVSAIPGAAIEGAAKATKLHMVLSWLRETNDSGRVATLATGTPIANSVTEAYVLMRYLAPHLLEEMGLAAFDNWAATFGEVVSQLEPDAKGNGYVYKARFSRFFNVPELMAAYRTFADVRLAEDLNLPTPPVRHTEDGQRGETVLIPPTPAQREFIKALPHQPWVRKPGGVLKALGEGLRASLDLDLVDASDALAASGMDAGAGGKDLGSKLPYAAEKIAEIWRETKDIVYPASQHDPTPQPLPGGLQLVFLDEGTPGSTAKHGADLYADLREELVERGLPRESIRFVHEANTDRKKEKLFADCRAGRVSVLIGSTQKMGTGTNIQDRAVALHHLSYPWRPADMAQRDGRIERRGNLNVPWVDGTPDDVRILYYITERTFDEFRLTTLARKARFISQIQRSDFNLREIEDIGAEAINLGMLAALSSGDPTILQLAEATAERARLQGLARSWDRQQDSRAQQLADLDDFLTQADTALAGMRAALLRRRPTSGDAFAMTVEDATYRSREEAADALGTRMVELARDQSLRPGQRVPIGTLGGLDFHGEVSFDHAGRRQLRLRFAWGHVTPLGQRDDRAQWQATHVTQATGRGAVQALERFLSRLEEDIDKLSKSVAAQRGRREEIAANLRPKEDNPYRLHARSKEREERALGRLVVANEKEAALADRVERAAGVNAEYARELNEELASLREEIATLRKAIADEHAIQEQARSLARGDLRTGSGASTAALKEPAAVDAPETGPPPTDETTTQAPAEPAALERPETPAPDAMPIEEAGPAAAAAEAPAPGGAPSAPPPQEAASASAGEQTPAPPEPETEDAEQTPPQDLPGAMRDRAPHGQAGGRQTETPTTQEAAAAPSAAAEPEPHTGPSPEMARCAAVLRYYEPLLQRHGLSGAEVVAYIDRPGVGYSYDPDNPLLDLAEKIAHTGERLAGVYPRGPRAFVIYEVGEERGRAGEQLTLLSADLITLYSGETEPLLTVDLEAILAAPPGAVIELPPAPEPAAEQPPATVLIKHDAEGTTVHGTRRGERMVHEALHDNGFRWSRRQQMWYQPRHTPLDEREGAVRGLRAAFDALGAAYTYQGLEPEPETDSGNPQENRAQPTAGTTPDVPSQTALEGQPDDGPAAAHTTYDTTVGTAVEQLGLFGDDEASTEQTSPASRADFREPMPGPDAVGTRPSPPQAADAGHRTSQPQAPAAEPQSASPAADTDPDAMPDAAPPAQAGDSDTTDAAPAATEEPAAAGEVPSTEDPPVPERRTRKLAAGTPPAAPGAGTGDAPPPPEAPATRPQTAAPERTEEPSMATPATEPAQAPPARFAPPAAEAAPEPSREETAPAPAAVGGERPQTAETAVARTQPESQPGIRPEPPAQERGDALQARALARAAAAPSREQQGLPLWTGTDLPTGTWREESGVLYDAYGAPQWRLKTASETQPPEETRTGNRPAAPGADAYESVDLRQAFASTVAEAWADIVPPEHGTVEDLLEAVEAPLRELEEQWLLAVPAPRADGERQATPVPGADRGAPVPARRDPEPVNAALRQADTHAAALQDFPEWQQLQTVRGATTHLWNVLSERAGAYLEQLRNDLRVQGFWRTVSIRTTTAIARGARALADRVRRGRRGGDLPTAEALLKLSDAALIYSAPGIPRPDRPASAAAVGDHAAEVGQLRATLRTGAPVPYGTREEAAQASREVAQAFQAWRQTPMGQELTTASDHPRVVAFRQAWQRLPAADLPDGPGPAAGPYGDVGRSAQALVERAEAANAERARAGQPPRFAEADVDALRAVATLAEHHGGRLAVTLPPGLTGSAARRAAAPQVAAPRPKVAASAAPPATTGSPGMSA